MTVMNIGHVFTVHRNCLYNMNQIERLARIDEVNRFEDFCASHNPQEYLEYSYRRTRALDELAGPLRHGEQLEILFQGHTYLVHIESFI